MINEALKQSYYPSSDITHILKWNQVWKMFILRVGTKTTWSRGSCSSQEKYLPEEYLEVKEKEVIQM